MYKLNPYGIERVEDGAIIPVDPENRCYQEYLAWVEGGNTPDPEYTADEIKANNLKAIADRRFIEETAGMEVQGMPVYTDRTTQMKLTAASLRAQRDSAYTVNWKLTTGGFMTLDAATLIYIGDKVGDYVQECYNRESELVDAVLDGSYTESMLDEGWPNTSANKGTSA
jgi:hypothetical protein